MQELRQILNAEDTQRLKDLLRRSEDKQAVIDEAAKHPLNTEQIEVLSNLSEYYIIPGNQTECAPQALIFYCATDRIGAEEEASKMEQAFRGVGFKTHVAEWNVFVKLRLRMRKMVRFMLE